jgi:transposase
MSQREVQEGPATVFHIEVGLGSIAALEQAVSTAVAASVEEASRDIQRQPMRNVDETPWWERAKHLWLWVKSTPLVTVFHLLKSRGAVGARAVIGEEFPGAVGTDRLAAYHWIAPEHRQVCWAHLKRDFVAISERGDASARLGLALLAAEHRLFTWWAEVRAGTLSRPDFQVRLLPVMMRVK